MSEGRVASDVIERVVATALTRQPDAPVAAMSPDGLFAARPDDLAPGHPVPSGQTALDLVITEDRPLVLSTWARARATGAAQAVVRLAGEPERSALLQFADLRHRHGVFVLIVLLDEALAAGHEAADGEELKPRWCQMRRSELAFVLEADDASARMFGWPADSMVGRRSIEMIHPEDHDRAIDNWLEMLGGPGRTSRWRGRYLNADGSWTWVEITNHNRLADPEHGDVLTEMVNIDDEMAMHEALRAREELIRELTRALPVGVLQVELDGRVAFTNPRLHEILDTRTVVGIDAVRERVLDRDLAALDGALDAVLVHGQARDLELATVPRADGSGGACQVNLRPLRADSGAVTGAIVCLADITESVRLRDELEVRATYDALTGCHNRASTLRQLGALTHAGTGVGVVFIDLDDFKPVNDEHGHALGDELLSLVSQRLCGAVRNGDVVGRIGGDEFVVLHPGVSRREELTVLAERLQDVLTGDAELGPVTVRLRASVGAALAAGRADVERVMAEADAAMYEAKRGRLGRPVVFDAGCADPAVGDRRVCRLPGSHGAPVRQVGEPLGGAGEPMGTTSTRST